MDEVKNAAPQNQTAGDDVEKGKGIAWLSYLGILWLVPLLAAKENSFCKFHVKQGIMLTILGVAIWIIAWIPFLGWLLGGLVWLFIIIMAIIGIINAASGKYWKMPLLGGLAENWFKF
uniref:DUF4870 domain-containing protein n=1 Tax=candidate division WOR-3 bacterium TaxID=2052148 RepID=A0A7C4GAR2_UNCW3